MSRRWCINGRFLSQSVTGVQRYGRQVLQSLDALMAEGHPLVRNLDLNLIVPHDADDIPALPAIETRVHGKRSGYVWEQFELPSAVGKSGLLNFCSTGPLAIRKQVVCVHDVNTRLVPQNYSWQFRTVYRLLMPALGRRAEAITTVSEYSAGLLHRYKVSAPAKTHVIGNGHEHARRWLPMHSDKTRAAAGANTILVFGTASPNKNVKLLVGMAHQLAENGFRLAISGAANSRVFQSQGLAAAANVTYLGRLSDNEIAALLQDCLCLAFPSFQEGFGLPPLEAMALGCPVIVSDTSCLPEICGDAALYASPYVAGQWLGAFIQLRDRNLRDSLIQRGKERAKRYSWRASAVRYLELMAKSDAVALPAVSVAPQRPTTSFAR